jgi:predicted CoA-binding protein
MTKTLVLGASTNPTRYSNMAVLRLRNHDIEVVPVGLRNGSIGDIEILTGMPAVEGIDTVTMYVGAQNQPAFYDYIVSLKPRRVIFNPGSENAAFETILQKAGIKTIHACTLVMLSIGNYKD